MFIRFGFALLFFGRVSVTDATVDLNDFHLQLIADEVTVADCQLLTQKLYSENKAKVNPFTCLDKLKKWNYVDGRQTSSLITMTTALKTLGYFNLANRLSIGGLHERSEEVKRFFLRESFKAMRNENSIIKDDESRFHPREKTFCPETDMKTTPVFSCMQMLIIMFTFFCLLVLTYLILKVFPYVRKHVKSTVRDISTV